MISAATLQIILILLQDAPELIQAVIADFNLFAGGSLTEAQLVAQIKAMNTAWAVATSKWSGAAQPGDTVTVAAPSRTIDDGAVDATVRPAA